jgi:hypothetical protein
MTKAEAIDNGHGTTTGQIIQRLLHKAVSNSFVQLRSPEPQQTSCQHLQIIHLSSQDAFRLQ